jgi:hypothetical protein
VRYYGFCQTNLLGYFFTKCKNYTKKGDITMPLETHNAINAEDADLETLLENDNSKDLKLNDEQTLANANAEIQAQPRSDEK